jgi:adenosine deaminase
MTIADLCHCILNACEGSFLPFAERRQLITSVRADLARDWGYQS